MNSKNPTSSRKKRKQPIQANKLLQLVETEKYELTKEVEDLKYQITIKVSYLELPSLHIPHCLTNFSQNAEINKAKKGYEIEAKRAHDYKFKLEKLKLVMASREDNFTKIIEGLVASAGQLKSACDMLFMNTSHIYQNLTLMIENDFSYLKKVTKNKFSCEETLNKKFKKYLSAKLVSKIKNLDYDFSNKLNFEDLSSSQSKLIKELRGRKYLNNDQMAMLLDRTGMSRRDDQSVSERSDILNQSLNISHLSPKYELSPNQMRGSKLTQSGVLPKMNLLGLSKQSPTKYLHRKRHSGVFHQSMSNLKPQLTMTMDSSIDLGNYNSGQLGKSSIGLNIHSNKKDISKRHEMRRSNVSLNLKSFVKQNTMDASDFRAVDNIDTPRYTPNPIQEENISPESLAYGQYKQHQMHSQSQSYLHITQPLDNGPVKDPSPEISPQQLRMQRLLVHNSPSSPFYNDNFTSPKTGQMVKQFDDKIDRHTEVILENSDLSTPVSPETFQKVDDTLNFMIELQNKNNRLLIAETGNMAMKKKVEEEITKIKEEITEKEKIMVEKGSKFSKMVSELKSQHAKLAQINDEISQLQAQTTTFRLAINVLKFQTLPEQENNLEILKEQVEDLESEKLINLQKVALVHQKIEQIQKNVESLTQSNALKKNEIESKKLELKRMLIQQVEQEAYQEKYLIEENMLVEHLDDF